MEESSQSSDPYDKFRREVEEEKKRDNAMLRPPPTVKAANAKIQLDSFETRPLEVA